MRRKFLITGLLSFVSGIFTRSFVPGDLGLEALIMTISIFFIIFYYNTRQSRFLAFLGLILFAFGFGLLRYEIKDLFAASAELKEKLGLEVKISGVVVDEPDERENSTRLVIETRPNKDKILIVARRFPQFVYGDELEFYGKLEIPENFSDFDYKAYLAKDDIHFQMSYPKIAKMGSGRGSRFKAALFGAKRKFLDSLSQNLPEPNASFIGGLTVGAKRSIPGGIMENFRKTGITHVVVISGYNIGIVARVVGGFFGGFLPYFLSIGFGFAGVFVFAVLTGGSAAVIRASVMSAILYFAGLTGRVYQAKLALFFAGFLMLMLNPKILRFDLGFQLSFLATLGLLYLSPGLEKFARWIPNKFNFREYALAAVSAQLATAPLILYVMGTFSTVALPANLLVVPFIPATMFLGFSAGVLGFIHRWLAAPFSWSAYFLSWYELKAAEILAGFSFSEINFSLPLAAAALIYLALIWFAFRLDKNKKENV